MFDRYSHIYTEAEHAPAAKMADSVMVARVEPLGSRCVRTVSTGWMRLLDDREEGDHPVPFLLENG